MNSVLSTCVERSNVVGSESCSRSSRARRALGPLLGLALLVSGCRSCSYHAHSEWHAGSGSSGGQRASEESEEAEQDEGSTRSTRRRSPGSRDNVVRVTGDGNKSQGGQGGGGDAPERTVVRPTGDVPPSSSGNTGQAAGGGGAQSGRSDGSAADASGKVNEPAAPSSPAQPAEPAAAPAEQAPDNGGKTTNKNPSEPHVTTPTQRKPRKVHRDGATNKEGRRE